MKKTNSSLSCLAFIVIIINLLSCQVGLGSSVDTESPTIAIEYPAAASCIKGEFVLAGSCSDDKGVTSVSVTVENTSTKNKYGPYEATVNSKKTSWSVNLNKASTDSSSVNGWSFPDGKYEVAVVASDQAGHSSGETSRAFEIDNTAPVFVITSPGITDIANPTEYGSEFKIEGTISDDHSVSTMKVSVFNKAGVEITESPFTETDIETAGGTSVTMAKNISGGTEEVNKRYEQIYGSNEGDVPFYLTVELVDSAKTYINPKETENTTVGNSTSSCYINDDVYSTLLSTKLTTSYGISYSDIKNILNGTISADTTVGTIVTSPASTLLKLLNEKVTDTRIKKLAFSLNPDANPRYVVSGYALPQDLSNIETGTRNQTVTVVASAGLDGTSILPETLKVWIKQLNSISDSSSYSEFINNPSESTGGILIADNSSYNSSSRSSYTYSVTLPNSIVTGKYYILAVTGTDADEEPLVADYVYGLLGDVSGSPPKISIDTPAELSSSADSDALTFAGVVSSTTATVSSLACLIVVTDETKSSSEAGYSVGTITGNAALNGTEWSFTPSNGTGYESCAAASGSGKRYLYTATFTASDTNGNSSYVTRNIHVDSSSPEVTISSVSPVVSRKSDGVKCVNGTMTLSGTINEADLEDVSYAVYIGKSETPSASGSLGAVYSFSKTFNTTLFTDLSEINIVLTAKDKAGNIGTYSTNTYNSSTSFIIDQSTDNPVVTPTNESEEITTVEQIKEAYTSGNSLTNIFGTTSNNKLSYSITDDDGVKSAVMKYKLVGKADYNSGTALLSNGTSTSCIVSGTLPAAEGLYEILLTVTDTVGTSTTYNLTSNSLVVAVDSGAPTLKVTSPTDGSYCSNLFTVTGSINDTSVTFNVPVCYVYNSAQNTYVKTDSVTATTPSVTNGVWKSTVTSNASAQYQVVFTAYDKYGQVGSASLNYKIDNVPPTFTVTKLGSDTVALSGAGSATSKFSKKSTLYSVSGTVTDTGSSEIGDFVYYNIATSTPAVVGTGASSYYDLTQDGWTKATITKKSSGNTWAANLDFSADYTEGVAYTIYLATLDNAGNVSLISSNPSSCVSITPDATSPVSTSVVSTPSSISASNSSVDVVITASVTDNLCGISSVSLYENGSSIATMSLLSGANYSCTLSNSNIKTGTHTYIVRATDSVGNTSSDDTYAVTLQVDKTTPNLSGLGVTPATTSGKMNGVLTISAIATDETSLASISWGVYSGDNSIVTSENYSADIYYKAPTIGASEKLYKSFSFKIDSRKISKGGGDYTLKVNAVDSAGNTSVTATYSLPLDQTTDKPAITLDAPADVTVTTEGGITSTKGLFKSTESISGTVTDDDGISEITIALDSKEGVAPTFSKGAKSISFTQALSGLTTGTLTEGAHTISITTKDTEFNTETSTGTFYIGVDDSAPLLEVTTESGLYYNKEFTVEGTATDSYSMAENNPVTFDGAAVTSYISGTGAWAKTISKPSTSESQTKTITATDKFGRTTSESFKYTFDLDNPAVSISAIDDNGNGNTLTENSIATTYFDKTNRLVVTGTASDSTLNSSCQSGLSSIKWILASGANASVPADTASWTTLAVSSSWTLNTDLSSKDDGSYTLWVKVLDGVGNTGSTSTNIYAIGKAPTLTETNLNSESVYKKDAFALGGSVTSGTTELSDMLSLKYTYNGSTTNVTGWTSGSGTWSLQGADSTEKTYSYTITATNKAKLSTTIKRTVVIDKTAPSATISIPLEETYYTSANMTVSGTASDATAGLKSIQIKYDSDADYTDVAVSKNWIANNTFTEGEHTVHLLVTDNAGNTSTIDRKFYMDLASPTSTLTYDTSTGSLYNTSTGKTGGAVSSISPDTTYLADALFTISGVISETFMDTATLSVSKDGGTSSTLWTCSDSKTWSYTQSATDADGTYIYTLYIKDKAGQTFTKSVTVIVDTTSPTLDVTSPATNESVEIATKTAKGTASDDGSGVKAVSYNLYTSDGVTPVTSGSNPVKGSANLIGESWSVSDMPLGTTEGTLILKVTATDKLSHTTEKTITFYYDKENPKLEETKVGPSGLTTNKAIELSGTVSDSNAISSLVIKDDLNANSSWTISSLIKDNTSQNWTALIYTGNEDNKLKDGTHVLTIAATDAAGKTKTLTRTVVIDTSIPSVNTKTITTAYKTYNSATWYNTTQLAVEVATADVGTGVSFVEYSTDYDTSNKTGSWNSLTKSSTVWKGTVSCAAKTENVYYIYFKATDVAGNTNEYATCYLQPNIDTVAPTASLHSVDTDTSFSGTKLVNGTKTVKVEISASDLLTGIASVKLSKIGSKNATGTSAVTSTTGGYYVVDIATEDMATGGVVFTATDGAGNSENFTLFQMQVDETKPTAKITSPTDADSSTKDVVEVNGKITLTGTASDNQTLYSVALYYSTDKSTWTKFNSVTGTYNWTSAEIDTTTAFGTIADGTSIYIKAVATDTAANNGSTTDGTTANTITLVVNQDTDRPVIKFTNIYPATSESSEKLTIVKMSSTVYGTVTDDDGTIASLEVSEDNTTWYDSASKYLELSSGVFNFTPATSGDGTKTLYFKVTDSKGNIFTTADSTALKKPYLQYSSDAATKISADSEIYFKVDTTAPAIDSKVYITSSTDTAFANKVELSSASKLGTTYETFILGTKVTDDNGIKSVTYSLDKGSEITAIYDSATGYYINSTAMTFGSEQTSVYHTIEIKVVDNATLPSTASRTFLYDSTEPTIGFISPLDGDRLCGDLTIKGTTNDGDSGTGIVSVKYMIPKTADASGVTKDSAGWNDVDDAASVLSWKVSMKAATFYTYATSEYGTEVTVEGYTHSNIWNVPVYFRVEDGVGNVNVYKDYNLEINPDADKPTASITYPEKDDVFGGRIRITGTAEDNGSVGKVYVRIDADNDGDYDEDDKAKMKTATGKTATEFSSTESEAQWWGFEASNTTSWFLAMEDTPFYKTGATTQFIKVQARAIDTTNKVGLWSTAVSAKLDKGAPVLANLCLRQYADNTTGTGNVTAEKTYVDDMWISGKWWLYGTITDETKVSTIVLSKPTGADQGITGSLEKNSAWFSGATPSYTMNIPVDTTTFSSTLTQIQTSIEVSDEETSSSRTISIKYDNTAPTLKGSLYHTSMEVESNKISKENPVQQSNKTYSIISSVQEAGSGFERIAIYFLRAGKTTDRIYMPCYTSGYVGETTTAGVTNRTDLTTTAGNGNLVLEENGLPWYQLTDPGTKNRTDETTFTNDDIKSNYNIRVGGLVRIGGIICEIKAVDRTAGTVTLDTSVATTYLTAEFAYALNIDNKTVETAKTYGTKTGNATEIANDDGDLVVESIDVSTSTYTWEVDINSNNIPDGPITICYVAYDKSGNTSYGSSVTSVQNNRPALSKVTLGTDLSGNNSIETSEQITYSTLDLEGNAQSEVAKDVSSTFTAKALSSVTPEFVGGNGDIYYYLTSVNELSALKKDKVLVYTSGTKTYTPAELSVADLTKADDKAATLNYKFWDSTEELEVGSGTQWATLALTIKVDVVDGVAPTATIDPFHWTSAENNSLYNNSSKNGHIELEDDLPSATFNSTKTGIYDIDPKVSGKITITGTVYDDVRLGGIKMSVTGLALNGGTAGTLTSLATCDKGTWTVSNGDITAKAGWAFKVTDGGITQDGHSATWQLDIDTSKVENVAATDVAVNVQAVDAAATANVSDLNTTQTDATKGKTPYYKMDVVPYITGITTWVSGNAGDEFARSALGYYDVYAGESVVINGFNLKSGSTDPTVTINTKTGTNYATVTASTTTSVTTTIGTSATSGELKVTVNSIDSINNIGSNPTFTTGGTEPASSSKSLYNSWANKTNNNRLTDDIKMYVWNMGYFVNNTNITDPVMKMDSKANYYMAYGKGVPELVYNKNGTERRIDYSYNKFHNNAVAYDASGNTYTVSTNTDRVKNSSAKFKFYIPRSDDCYSTDSYYQYDSDGYYIFDTDTAYLNDYTKNAYCRNLEQAYNHSTKVYDIDRVQKPKMMASGNGNVYMIYYDGNHTYNPVKFRYGTVSGINLTGGISTHSQSKDQGIDPSVSNNSASGYSIIADKDTKYKGGMYTAVGATSGGIPVVAWYDASGKQLIYSYNNTASTTDVGGVWQTNAKVIDSSYAGWYVDMCVDSKDGIHIAYYNTGKGDLKYAYLPSYDCAAKNIQVVTVDSYLSAGTQISISARDEKVGSTTYIVPYISYYHASFAQSPSAIRVAWMPSVIVKGKTPTIQAGAKNDLFTQVWEVAVIPTTNVPTDSQVCIGLPATGNTTYGNSPVLGYMSDAYYEKAYIKY